MTTEDGYASSTDHFGRERQITQDAGGHILTNCHVWSPDGQWVVFDTRSDADGARFDGSRIAIVHADTGEVRTLYEARNGAHCGVATFDPRANADGARVAFILGPETPTADWTYGPAHRQGVIVEVARPGIATNLDARDLHPPRTPGALRGGSHVHVFSPNGAWVSFTYNDALLSALPRQTAAKDMDARNVGVAVPRDVPLVVPPDHVRNQDGAFFSVLVTRTTGHPRPGSDDLLVAQEEGWIGNSGYRRTDGTRQRRALAFQGTVLGAGGSQLVEVFVADLPDDLTRPSPDGPLEGTPTRRPLPPLGTTQRRVTHTEGRRYPGIQGARHWLRSSPDGAQIATLMRDDRGVAQLWTVSPNGDGNRDPKGVSPPLRQITHDPWDVASTFTWSPDGTLIAYVADGSIFTTHAATGLATRRTPRPTSATDAPLPLACVFSPDGRRIAYLRRENGNNQIFVVTLP